MSNEIPAILLMFANQQDAYLDKLKEESKEINSILSGHDDKGTIKVFREESASIKDINDALLRFEDRVAIFHYAGHADANSLKLEGGAGDATGIAELLGKLPNLKLVFLNGCSTQGQVKYLLQSGVKAVIATAVPIDDNKAVVFAQNFYRALSNFHSIESAFLRTVALMRTIYGGSFEATVVRSGQEAIFDDTQAMPWGLYLGAAGEESLAWEIPAYHEVVAQKNIVETVNFKVNQELQEVIKTLMEINPMLEQLSMIDGEIDSRAAILQIIQNFPWPIATQIRLLVARDGDMDTPSVERIKQIVSVYVNTTQFLFYTAISQLWHEKQQKTIDTKSYLVDILYINNKQQGQFDYLRHFIEIVEILQANNIELFVPAFADVVKKFKEGTDLHKAYGYLESMRSAIHTGQLDKVSGDLVQKSADSEYHLSSVLIDMAFLIEFKLITIRDIHVVNPRYLGAQFNHYMRSLNVSVGNIAVGNDALKLNSRSFDMFSNNASVILTQDIQNPDKYLSLSPFIIDVNSFKTGMTEDRATEQQLFMYAHRTGQGAIKDYLYYSTFHSTYVARERLADQFIVKGSDNDNDENNTSGRAGRSTRRKSRRRATKDASTLVNHFDVLKQQFEILEKDLIK